MNLACEKITSSTVQHSDKTGMYLFFKELFVKRGTIYG